MDRRIFLYISGLLRIYIMNECGTLLNDYPTCNEIIMTVHYPEYHEFHLFLHDKPILHLVMR